MSCCPAEIQTFNGALLVLPYTADQQAKFGANPKLEIMYQNEEGNYTNGGINASIQFKDNTITIDNGGPAKGVLKIS